MKKKVLFSTLLCLLSIFSTRTTAQAQSVVHPDANGILYVSSAALSGGDGSSWQKALSQLADALKAANILNNQNPGIVKQIWVAKGTYAPLYKVAEQYNDGSPTSNRDKSFVLVKNVQLYGGFSGDETSLAQRDITQLYTGNSTVLTGILGSADTAYHVFISAGNMGTALIDGFTITGGNADLLSVTSGPAVPEYPMDTLKVNGEDVINYGGGGLFNANSSPTISHMIIESNKGILGGGIYNGRASSPTISKVTIRKDTATSGGGICNFYAFPGFSQVSIVDNIAQSGGGAINIYGTPVFTNVIISGNSSAQSGGGVVNGGSAALFTNTIITDNTALIGGGVANSVCSPEFTNVTFSGNTAEYGGGIYNANQSNPTLRNSIVLGNMNTKDIHSVYVDNGSSVSYNYSLIDSVYYKANNPADTIPESKNDIFSDPSSGDYMLIEGAWAIDKGNNDYYSKESIPDISKDTTDLAGNPRIFDKYNGGIVDLGAYEYQGSMVRPDNNGILYVDSMSADGDGSSWNKALNNLSIALAFANNNMAVKEIHVAKGTYYPTGAKSGTSRDSTFLITRNGLKIYGGYPHEGGARDKTAYPTILSGDIGAKGEGADNSFHVMVITHVSGSSDSLLISGFTFCKGNANGTDIDRQTQTLVPQNYGGGVLLSGIAGKVIFDSCRFVENNADHGGGIYQVADSAFFNGCTFSQNNCSISAESSGGGIESGDAAFTVLVNCIISGNQAPLGGGIRNENNSSATLINCTVTGNSALLGGGLINDISATSRLINCTISGNNAGQPFNNGSGGGIEGTGSSCTLVNCILWGNSGGIVGTPTVNYSLIQGWQGDGSGNFPSATDPGWTDAPAYTTAPFTAGNYGLLMGSPVINGGDNAALPAYDTIDLAGNARIFDKSKGGIVDLGAYEYQGNPIPTVITRQPQDTAVCTNGNATYTVVATGANIQYQWQSSADSGNTWENIPNGLSDDLKLSNVSATDSGMMFRVIVSGDWNKDTSNTTVLSVFTAPVITTQPQSQKVSEGSDVAFTVEASGLHLQYQWQSYPPDGFTGHIRAFFLSLFGMLRGINSAGNTDQWKNIIGANGPELYLTDISKNDNGTKYRVIITGTCGEETSQDATLTVIKSRGNENPPLPGCLVPRITMQPVSQSVCPDETVTFSVTVSGSSVTYQWQTAPNDRSENNWSDIRDANSRVLTLPSISENNDGRYYRVKVTNACGATVYSNTASLRVYEEAGIRRQPTGGFSLEGQGTSMTISTYGDVTGYQWQQLYSVNNNATWKDIPGATQSTLVVKDVTPEDDGKQYRVIVYGLCNTIVSKAVALKVGNLNIPIPFFNRLPFFSITSRKANNKLRTKQGKYLVYPNPVRSGVLTIESPSGQPLGHIILYTISGQRVLQTRTDNTRITLKLPRLIPGIYILKITDHNLHIYSEKIILQNTGPVFR